MLHLCGMNKVGIGTRVLNFIVDTLLVFFISLGLSHWYDFYVYYYRIEPVDFYVFFFGTMVLYYLVFETFFKRTPGKWLSMSKVVSLQDKRPALWQILLRSIARVIVIDFLLLPFLDVTLHDYVSRTKVVEA